MHLRKHSKKGKTLHKGHRDLRYEAGILNRFAAERATQRKRQRNALYGSVLELFKRERV